MGNLGWKFYKEYFRDINWDNIDEEEISAKVDDIINSSVTRADEEALGNIHFKATTTYPGLLLGSGYLHELPSIEGQAILGFDFDYTTGLPIIRGSSIKGVLRSAFKHTEYIKDILSNQDIDIEKLEKEIFENNDIFFDATIVSGGKILADDYLCPHGEDPLKNPTPLRFIKVAPNIDFRFDFLLSDGIISKEEKVVLFGQILYDLGVGAKTNVGYGKFDDKLTKDKLEQYIEDIKLEKKMIEEYNSLQSLNEFRNFIIKYPTYKKDYILSKIKELELIEKEQEKERREKEKLEKEQEAQAKLEALASMGIEEIIKDIIKYKVLENSLKKYMQNRSLSEEEKDILENHILNNMQDKIKRKKFPFGTFGNDKCLGKDRANNIADKLGL